MLVKKSWQPLKKASMPGQKADIRFETDGMFFQNRLRPPFQERHTLHKQLFNFNPDADPRGAVLVDPLLPHVAVPGPRLTDRYENLFQ